MRGCSRNLGPLVVAVVLTLSGRSESQLISTDQLESEAAEAAAAGCSSVVLVQCAQPETVQPARSSDSESPASLKAVRQRLQSRRLRQVQEQVGLNAIEVTGQRPTEAPPDEWETFRQSVSNAATPDCFAPSTQGGLLRFPYLLHQAAVGKCR